MGTCDVPSCSKAISERVVDLALSLCDWHAYEYHNELGWLGKIDEEDVKHTIPKMKDEDNNEGK